MTVEYLELPEIIAFISEAEKISPFCEVSNFENGSFGRNFELVF